MTDARQYAVLLKLVKHLDDPRGVLFLLLLDALQPIEKARLLSLTKQNVRTLETGSAGVGAVGSC